MYTCILCRFTTELDDVVLNRGDGSCVCVGCFARQTDDVRLMDKALARSVAALMLEVDA